MRNEAVIFKVVPQVGDIAEALAFHDDERAEHGFLRKTGASRFGAGQLKVERAEKPVVKRSGALRSEQGDVVDDFLSVDSGQPLSVVGFVRN